VIFYDDAWRRVRANLKCLPLEDELLWHKVFEEYVNSLPPVELGASRDELIERHLRIVGPIAGQIAWKRTPHSFGIWAKESPILRHVGLVHELTAIGNLALFIAADRYDPKSGKAFSTYANFWIKKFVRLYLEELISIVPRTGDKDGGPRVSVMDRVDAALEGRRLYRGKASGGMAMFDCSLALFGPKNEGDKEIEVIGTGGITDPTRLDYLQRHVGQTIYPWRDMGSRSVPRFELPGHAGGKASDAPPREHTYQFDPADETELPAKPVPSEHTGPSMKLGVMPAEICYLDKRCGSFNSWDQFGEKPIYNPKPVIIKEAPHWRNSIVFAVDYLRRFGRMEWRKPICEEQVWPAELAA
jgi:Sigma-70 region 2